MTDLVQALPLFIVLLLSLTVHEFAHAWTAHRFGDDTAARMGRMTINPIAHIDLIGTIVLPLTLILAHVPPIGWAKPVPVNPANFRRGVRMSVGDTVVSIAGPLSNLAFALVAVVALGVLGRFAPALVQQESAAGALLGGLAEVNVLLAVFNVVPIPPLDGSHVVGHLLPRSLQPGWDHVRRFGPLILLVLLYLPLGPGHAPILWSVLAPAQNLLLNLLELVRSGLAA